MGVLLIMVVKGNAVDKLDYNGIDCARIPEHIAIIMDGNGRWARKRHRPRPYGHRAGMEALRRIIEVCADLGVRILTVYAFSTENWKRPSEEVNFLMNLLVEYVNRELGALQDKNVRIRVLGMVEQLEPRIQQEIKRATRVTAENTGLVLNIALNYGGRAEIIEAARRAATLVSQGELTVDGIDEGTFSRLLFTEGLPDPDLLIRTAGEMRVSNFLLWQIAYTELWVTEVLWPDFSKDDLIRAIIDYQKRERRFGAIDVGKGR